MNESIIKKLEDRKNETEKEISKLDLEKKIYLVEYPRFKLL